MDDCVLYSLIPETGRLTPFGSFPVERATQTEAESFMERPTLGRVVHDRAPVILRAADEQADPMERKRLDILGRRVMLLLPLFAHSDPVGVAELTSHRSVPSTTVDLHSRGRSRSRRPWRSRTGVCTRSSINAPFTIR
jgi:hypothetical protein